jgi:hypothetical protein
MLTPQAGIQVDRFYPPTDWQYSFPEGYTRLEYLESTGTQYIDTGYYLQSNNLKVKVKFTFDFSTYSSEKDILGSFGSNRFSIGTLSRKVFAYSRTGNTTDTLTSNTFNGIQTLDSEIIYDYDNSTKEIKIDGNTISGTNTIPIASTSNLLLLGPNLDRLFIGKIYYCQIYDNETLIRNFVPVKRNSDNKPGMYDLVNDVFYVNAGTGEFVMGTELYSNNSQIDIRQKNNTNFVEKYKFNENNELIWANPQLNLSGPVGYTKVGNPTITDGIISDTNGSNFLSLPEYPNINNVDKFELQIKYSASSVVGGILFYVNATTGGMRLQTLSSGQIRWYTPNIIFATNKNMTDYNYVKVITKKGIVNVEIYVSIDGIAWEKATLTQMENAQPFVNGKIKICRCSLDSYDLKETYIKVNDEMWFYGKNYTSENYAPVPAGLNYNNTTTPSIGYVNTQTQEFIPAPTDGIKYSQTRDIRVTSPEDNTITLLYGVKSDFSKYALFGLLADTSSGNYDVYIDDVLYATTTKNTQTDIDFSALGSEYVPIGTCTTPEELTLHKIVVKPSTSGETLTAFRCARTSGSSGVQQQGCLWTHFELENMITLTALLSTYQVYANDKCMSITAQNNTIFLNSFNNNITGAVNVEYVPIFDGTKRNSNINYLFLISSQKLKRLIVNNNNTGRNGFSELLRDNLFCEQITGKYSNYTLSQRTYDNNYKLKVLPVNNQVSSSTTITSNRNLSNLYPTKINLSNANDRTQVLLNGSSTYPMYGLRGLKVSNEAPFTGTSPQINVSYTGLDRDALVELFESIPGYMKLDKVGEPTINSDGVASDFAYNRYIATQKAFDCSKDFDIVVKTNTGTILSQNLKVLIRNSYSDSPGQTGFVVAINQNKRVTVYILNESGNYISSGGVGTSILAENTDYYFRLSQKLNEGIYTIAVDSSVDGINWVRELTRTSTLPIRSSGQGIAFGGGSFTQTLQYWGGSIDFKNSYIIINNARYQFQLPDDTTSRVINITAATGNNLTQPSGSNVTIDANGVASGFSSSDYLQSVGTISYDNKIIYRNSFELKTKVVLPNAVDGEQEIIYFPYRGVLNGITFKTTNGRIVWYALSSFARITSTNTFNLGDTIYIKAVIKNEVATLYSSTDDINWTTEGFVTLTADAPNTSGNAQVIRVGVDGNSTVGSIFGGSIDLENTYIKVGQNYIMKSYLTDNDRLIATNKGWTITG